MLFRNFGMKPTKRSDNFFILFIYSFWGGGGDIDQLSRVGFDWTIRKVIFKVEKSGLAHFPVITDIIQWQRSAAQMWLLRCATNCVLQYERCGITLRGLPFHSQGGSGFF